MTDHPLNRFAHLATRLFNTPLLIHPGKAEIVVAALSERLGLTNIVRVNGDAILPRMLAMEDDEAGIDVRESYETRGYDVEMGIARIEIEGTLVHKLGTLRPSSGMMGYDGIRQNFIEALNDPAVKAIWLDIDSPGGEVSGLFDLVDTIYQARGTKPVWAILNESAFSSAYGIASAADHITVPRTGGTGSIGVVAMHVDYSMAIKNAGLTVTFIKHGERKIDGAPELPLSPEALERFQKEITAVGEMFEATVARNRGLSAAKIRDMKASTFLGAEGVSLGLADEVMAPDAAFRALLSSTAKR